MAGRLDCDVWNIVDNDKDSQHYGRNFRLDFSYISSEEIKDIVKDYVWQNYRVGNKTLSRLYGEVNSWFKHFIKYADAKRITCTILDEVIVPMEMVASFTIARTTSRRFSSIRF